MITASLALQFFRTDNLEPPTDWCRIWIGNGVHSSRGLSLKEAGGGRDCIPARVMASLLKAHTLVTSKLKSSLMLFIFKCSPLDRRHLVRHASQGRPRCSAFLGSITRRQPLGADTKGVGLTRDLLWNLSQSCATRRKHKCTQLLVYTHFQICRNTCLPPQHLPQH